MHVNNAKTNITRSPRLLAHSVTEALHRAPSGSRGNTDKSCTRRGSRWRREAMASNRGAEEMLVVCVSLSDQPFCCTSRPPLTHRGALPHRGVDQEETQTKPHPAWQQPLEEGVRWG